MADTVEDEIFDPHEAERHRQGIEKVKRYYTALSQLKIEDSTWTRNYQLFISWTLEKCLWWIESIEAQAQAGQNTIGARLVARVVANRLDS